MSNAHNKDGKYRGIIDEIREQQRKMQDMTWKERFAYYWEYYKVHTIVTIVAIIAIVCTVRTLVNTKDYAFYGLMLNAYSLSSDVMSDTFSEYAGIDTNTYECFMDQYAVNQIFYDLREVLTPEQIEKYEPYFYYVDMDIVRAQEDEDVIVDTDAIAAKGNLTLEEIHELAATRMDPSTMGDPVPVGIVMTDSPFATESHSYDDLVPVFGISVTTQRMDTCLQFLDYLWDDTVDFSLAHDEATPY